MSDNDKSPYLKVHIPKDLVERVKALYPDSNERDAIIIRTALQDFCIDKEFKKLGGKST